MSKNNYINNCIFKKGTRITLCIKGFNSNIYIVYDSSGGSGEEKFPGGETSISLGGNIKIENKDAAVALASFLANSHGLAVEINADGCGWIDRDNNKYFSFILK